MDDRKKKHRTLKAVGVVHAKGHILATDKPKFDRLVTKAVDRAVMALRGDSASPAICVTCGLCYADVESKTCVGCDAYADHTA